MDLFSGWQDLPPVRNGKQASLKTALTLSSFAQGNVRSFCSCASVFVKEIRTTLTDIGARESEPHA